MKFRKRFKPEMAGFQLAPMIDIVFNLLCFFIVAQIFAQWETEISVKIPTAQTGHVIDRLPGEVILNILKDGKVVVNRQALDESGLRNLLQRIVKLFPGQPVLIRADRGTPYGDVVRVLDLCRQSDIWNIAFAVGLPEETAVR
jgi:biopolymer transport protein ExbD